MTDTELTLHALLNAGPQGVHSFELNRLVGTIRAAARVNDLKRMGYQIKRRPEKRGNARGVRYTLVGAPEKKPAITIPSIKPRLIFDRQRQTYVETVFVPPVQESFL